MIGLETTTHHLGERPFTLFSNGLGLVIELVWKLHLRLDHDCILPSVAFASICSEERFPMTSLLGIVAFRAKLHALPRQNEL